MADVMEDALASAAKEVVAIAGEANVLVIPTDVSSIDDVVRLRDKVYEAWGEVSDLRHSCSAFLIASSILIHGGLSIFRTR